MEDNVSSIIDFVVGIPNQKQKHEVKKNNIDGTQNKPCSDKTELQDKPKAECSKCKRVYSTMYSLHRHQKNCKPVKERKHACDVCQMTFTVKSNLSSHKRKFHNIDVSPQSQDTSILSDSAKYICDICRKCISNKSNLVKHKQKVHGIRVPPTLTKNFKCSLCNSGYPSKESFYDHLNKLHNLPINIESLEFENLEDFEKWKYTMEKETSSKYYIQSKYKKAEGLYTTLYVCHRYGTYRMKGTGKRRLKNGGTNKIDYFCPSSIYVQAKCSENSFIATVKFISTHLGHKCEAGKLCLSKPKKTNRKINFQEEAKNAVLGFVGKYAKYSSQEQCAEIIKSIAILTHKCETLAEQEKKALPPLFTYTAANIEV